MQEGQEAELPDVEPVLEEARRTARTERRRATRQRALADTAVEVASLTSLEDVLRTVTDRARRIIGARRAATTHLPDGWEDATVVTSGSDRAWRDPAAVPRGPGPLDAVIREGRPLRLDGAELAAPEWAGLHVAGQPPLPDYLAVPLVGADGVNHGLIQLSGKTSGGHFTDDDEAALAQLAQMAAAAIDGTVALEAEREARARAEERARLRGLLADASKAFAASLEPEETLRTLGQFIVPGLADWCCVHVPETTGEIRLAHVSVGEGPQGQTVADVMERLPVSLEQKHGPGAAMRTGRGELFRRMTDDVVESLVGGDVGLADLRLLRASTAMVVPLRARGRVLGACSLARRGRAYAESEMAFVQDLVQRAALSLDNASRYAFEREVAVTLQRSLLPQALPPSPAVTTASRYLPGASGTEIGGDWYDVVGLGDGRLGIVVGDVMGRGLPAAAVMGQLRAAVRAYALEGHEPAELLAHTDVVVEALGQVQITTCVYGVLDPAARELQVASAGHLPPLVVDPSGTARFLVLDPNMPLGVGAGRFSQTTVPLSPGSTVVLYTDGLVEGRDFDTDEGMARLLETAQGGVRSPDELCDRLLRAMGRDGDHDDDTAILAITLGPIGAGGGPSRGLGGRELELEPLPGAVPAAREFVARALAETGLEAPAEVAVLLVSELVTNAVHHAGSTLTVAVAIGRAAVRVEVRDLSPRLPALREPRRADDEWGRGLVLVDALANRWGAERLPSGKRVWFELDLAQQGPDGVDGVGVGR